MEDIDILLRLTQPESYQKNEYVFHHHKNDIVSCNYKRQQLGKERFHRLTANISSGTKNHQVLEPIISTCLHNTRPVS